MGSGPPKVRFVKCPRCMQILPEFANIPVYKCGGCDLILRAKHLVAVGSTRSEEPYNKSEPAQNDVKLTRKIEAINHLKDSSSDTSSNSGDNNEAAESTFQKDGMRRISADCKSIDLSGKKEISSLSTTNVLEHNHTINTKPEDSSQKRELDYKFKKHDTFASSNELLLPSPSEITSSPDSVKRDKFGSSNQSVIDDEGCLDVLSVHEKEEPAQVGEHREEQGNNYNERFRSTRFSHEVTGVGKNGGCISYYSSQANEENYLPDNDHNQNLPLDSAPRRYADKMDDAESVISDEVINPKFSGALENLSKSPTTISSRAYYSNLSSNGDDYDISGPPCSRNVHFSRRIGVRSPRGAVSREGNLPVQEGRKYNIIVKSTEESHVRKMASNSSYEQFGSALSHCSDWNQDEQSGSRTAHGFQTHKSGNYMGTSARGVDSAQSQMEVDRAGASRFLEKIPPPYHENLTSIHLNGNASDQSQEIDADKMELIRKVQNLKDELNRLTIQRLKFEAKILGVSSDQEPLPPHHGLYYPLHPHGAYGSRIGHQARSSQLRFPGASNIRHHLECFCSRICSEDWQCQAQLPCDGARAKSFTMLVLLQCPTTPIAHPLLVNIDMWTMPSLLPFTITT